jgi:hypothetical protein
MALAGNGVSLDPTELRRAFTLAEHSVSVKANGANVTHATKCLKGDACRKFWCWENSLLMSQRMFDLVTLMTLIHQVSGTPYITGGDSPRGTDCSGLASWVSNMATGRPVYGDRFNTGNEESALLTRGFQYGTAPGALVIGWNGGHTAVTLPDGTAVSSGEDGGVKVGGGGAYQAQFTHHMFLPTPPENTDGDPGATTVPIDLDAPNPPAPAPDPAPAEMDV